MQIAPSNGLAHLIRHYLIYHPQSDAKPMRFFCDGSPGIVIPIGNSALPFLDQARARNGELLVYGLMEHAIDIPPPPVSGMVVIVLQPYTLALISGIESKKLKNNTFRFYDLIGDLVYPFQEAIGSTENVNEIIDQVEDFFFRLCTHIPPADPIITGCLALMQARKGNLNLSEMLSYLPISERQLERKFDQYIGVPPKKLSGIFRINHYLKLLRNPDKTHSALQAAIEAGFYDQAHLNNQFKVLTGTSPLKYLSASDPVALNLFNSSACSIKNANHHFSVTNNVTLTTG